MAARTPLRRRGAQTSAPLSAPSLTRRELARAIAGGVASALFVGAGARTRVAAATPAPACTLYPEQTEGPFYLDAKLLRRDITEGRSGTPLRLELRVVSATSCAALTGVAVDVWHCDAAGLYSGYRGQLGGVNSSGATFLRGTQVTDDEGRVVFATVFPGWYPGRTTHVHFKVHATATAEATSQIYFPEQVTSAVYESPPYRARGPKDTSNAADHIARTSRPEAPLATVTGDAARGLVATVIVGVAT